MIPRRYSINLLPVVILLIFVLSHSSLAQDQPLSEAIRLNQIGFYPNGTKIAVVVGDAQGPFQVATSDLKKVIFTGTLSSARTNAISGKTTHLADFSGLTKPGRYVVIIPGLGHSYP